MSVYRSMYEEVESNIGDIGKMELGSEQHIATVNCVNSMIDRLNECDKIKNEERKIDIEEKKLELEKARLASDQRGRLALNVITVTTTVAYVAVHVWTVLSDRSFAAECFMHTSHAGRSSRRSLLTRMHKFRT